jgi:hypothetical protein
MTQKESPVQKIVCIFFISIVMLIAVYILLYVCDSIANLPKGEIP